jgi:Sec-independent protein translocase protein TatA
MADDDRTQQVSLGCGTLILIALIVLIFSGRGTGDLEREVRELRSQVSELKNSVEAQTSEIKVLQQKLDKQSGAVGAAKGFVRKP